MGSPSDIDILDITDEASFARIPPCADDRFDHRSCDYWEDDVRGSKAARPHWWQTTAAPASRPEPAPASENPFAPPSREPSGFNPFAPTDGDDTTTNPFAPKPATRTGGRQQGPRKLRLLGRGERITGSYAKVLLRDGEPAAYAQFGPLSAYPRAQHIRDLYPQLPTSPLPAVITCIACTAMARGSGLGARLIEAVCEDLGARGFAAVEAYPDRTLGPDEASSADPTFWEACGFSIVAPDERFPVLRRQLT